jgi:hypothetical protein
LKIFASGIITVSAACHQAQGIPLNYFLLTDKMQTKQELLEGAFLTKKIMVAHQRQHPKDH